MVFYVGYMLNKVLLLLLLLLKRIRSKITKEKNGSEFFIYSIGFSSLGKSWKKGSRLKASVSYKSKQVG